jgi:transposase InsO family protein
MSVVRRSTTSLTPSRWAAFVVDIYSRAIVGWAAATRKRTKLVLDALQMALWRRDRDGHPPRPGLVHHSDAGSPDAPASCSLPT